MKRQQEKRTEKHNKLNNFAKYTGIGIQMAAVIGGGVFLGRFIDERRGGEVPTFTIICSLFGVFAGIYLAVKDFIKK